MPRRILWAVGALLLLAAASWLPARAVHTAARPAAEPAPPRTPAPTTAEVPLIDLGRPALAAAGGLPAHATSALQAVRSYFLALSWASNVPGPQVGSGTAPYAQAYAYLHPDWRAELPFEQFVASWRGIGHLDLLQAVPAGPAGPGSRAARVYVEVREYLIRNGLQAVAFADGFFTAAPTAGGWLLAGGQLNPENIVTSAFGGPDWWRDPGIVAGMYVSAQTKQTPSVGAVRVTGHTATVDLRVPGGGGATQRTLRVFLAQRVDRTWVPLYAAAAG